jgi:hypothetical protein
LEPLAFGEYCRFDTSAFFGYINRGLLYIQLYTKKAEISKRQYSSKAKGFNIRDFAVVKNTVPRTSAVGTAQKR